MNLLIPEIIPSFSGVLKGQGVPKEAKIKKAIENDIYSALELFKTLATPGYLIEEISTITFDEIYNSSGMNEGDSPLELIYPKSEKLALFVITVGEKVTNKISKLMKENEIVIASMLDTVASLAVENSVEVLEKNIRIDGSIMIIKLFSDTVQATVAGILASSMKYLEFFNQKKSILL